MKPIFSLVAAGLAFLGTGALAQSVNANDSNVEVSPGKVQYYSKQRREATVTSIDYVTRKVSLLMQNGEVINLTAGPEIRNFASVKFGDKVVANYEESMEVRLVKGGMQPVGRREEIGNTTAGQGGTPGAATSKKVVLTGDVIKVDKQTGVVTLQGATRTLDMTIRDPNQLELVKVGDQVQAVTTQILALSLDQAN